MHPILFELGGSAVHTYGALGALGFLLVAGIALYRAGKLGIQADGLADLIFWTSLVSLLGARLLFVLQNPEVVHGPLDVINYRKGGLVFYGALLTGVPFGTVWMLVRKLPVLAVWDVFATAMPLGHGMSRVGCFFAGCCWGAPTSQPWGVTYPHPLAPGPADTPVHPVQLYEASALFLLGLILNLAYGRRKFDGQILGMYLLGYAAIRVVTELYRGDATRGFFLETVFGSLMSYSTGISALVACAGLSILGVSRFLSQRTEATG